MRHFASFAVLGFFVFLALAPVTAQAQDLKALAREFAQHNQAGRYAEAERVGKQALNLCEARAGRDHIDCAWTLNDLANVYQRQGKYAEAERFHRRAL